MKFLLRWIINAAALILITHLVSGIVVSGWYAALVAALILGLINAIIRPILILLTLPLNILTLGLFTLVINALLFWFTSTLVKGFVVADFGAAFFGALVMTIFSYVTSILLHSDR